MGAPRAVVLAVMAGVCGCREPEPLLPDVSPPLRTVSVAWKVTDLADVELACEAVDARSVTMFVQPILMAPLPNDVFDCFREEGARMLEDGEYLIGFELGDQYPQEGALARVASRRFVVQDNMKLDDLTFQVDPRGTLSFQVDAPGHASNCGTGAGITAMRISVYDAKNTCLTVPLAIEGHGTYTTNCVSPNATICVDKGRKVTAADLPAGEYRIVVVGQDGSTDCWRHDGRHRIRAAGFTREVTLPLTRTCN